jgi:hypothetical protein
MAFLERMIQRVYDSKWEAAYGRLNAAPGCQELSQASDQPKAGGQVELYVVLE